MLVVSHTNICAEVIKPCSKLSKNLSHHSFKSVLVKNNNVKVSHRIHASNPTIELCSNDPLLKCLVHTGSDRTIIKFEKLQELESELKITHINIKVHGLNSLGQVVDETECYL